MRHISLSASISAKHGQQREAPTVRPPSSTEGSAEWKDADRKERGRDKLRHAMIAATLGAPSSQGSGPLDPPWPSPPFSPDPRRSACRIFSRDLRSTRLPFTSDREQQQLLQSRPVARNRALGARMERCLEVMGRLLGNNITDFGDRPR